MRGNPIPMLHRPSKENSALMEVDIETRKSYEFIEHLLQVTGILLVSTQEDHKVIRKNNLGDRKCAAGEGVQIMFRLNSVEEALEDLHSNHE